MDAMPPPLQCESPAQDVLLTVDGKLDEPDLRAFHGDLGHLDGGWTVVSDKVYEDKRILVLRAQSGVTYAAVASATFNANARNWRTEVKMGEPHCIAAG